MMIYWSSNFQFYKIFDDKLMTEIKIQAGIVNLSYVETKKTNIIGAI